MSGNQIRFVRIRGRIVPVPMRPDGTRHIINSPRIMLASKPALVKGHPFGDHSFIHLRKSNGSITTYSGQAANLRRVLIPGATTLHVVKNFNLDRLEDAAYKRLLIPKKGTVNGAIRRIEHNAAALKKHIGTNTPYSLAPLKGSKSFNSNSVVGTILRNSGFNVTIKSRIVPGFHQHIGSQRGKT